MRVAALDLGSNSFHVLVAEVGSDSSFEVLSKDKEMLRLGDEVARSGRVGRESADRAVATVGRFRDLAAALGAREVVAMATAAMREADNGAQLAERMEAETGTAVEIISGHREAELIFGAIRASVALEPSPVLALDLGGGSLEVMVGGPSELSCAVSVKLGVGRLTAELVRDDPPSAADCARVRRRVAEAMAPHAASVADSAPKMLVGSSGTLCTLARMAASARDGAIPPSVHQLRVGRADLAASHARILSLPTAKRRRLAGLDARRADLVPAGSLLLLDLMDRFGMDELTVSEWALREGIVLAAVAAATAPTPELPRKDQPPNGPSPQPAIEPRCAR